MSREERNRKKSGSLQRRRREPLHSPPPPARVDQDWRVSGPGREPGAPRKLSDSSNASEDLSKDSGCVSGKLSASDSSSEMSDSPGSDPGWTRPPAAPGGLRGCPSMELVTRGNSEEMLRELEELRSENEYLKDEVEELRCEMLEMRDVFQEDEVFQLQELRLQLEHSNKTCRILQYRLRQAERRSIRGPEGGQVDGEVVRTLEHDVKVARSVSLRLFQDLEALRTKATQVEQDNEELREKTQQLEVTCQVLQGEAERARETLKKRSFRSSVGKNERRLSQHLEDDSSDLHCQLHFAKEELSLMCKKLARTVSEGETMRDQLERYHAAYGDVDAPSSPQGKKTSSRRSREAELKAHLRLVEEEAMLLSRRIVELEVENRGLGSEVGELRERGGSEQQEEQERSLSVTPQPTREGPVGGEQEPSDCNRGDATTGPQMSPEDLKHLVALRDHAGLLIAALQLLRDPVNTTTPPAGGVHEAPELLLVLLLELVQRVEILMGRDHDAAGEKESSPEDVKSQVELKELTRRLNLQLHPKMQVSLQVLWILHQWSSQRDVKGRERTSLLLQELLDTLEMRDKKKNGEVSGSGGTTSLRMSRYRGSPKKNWLYVCREAARVDRDDPVKTWDHPVRPLGFPDLQQDPRVRARSHTAPEKSEVRIYFSPPSARRVRATQWNLYAGSSGRYQPAPPPLDEVIGNRKKETPGSGQPSQPVMVSVGLQTDGSPLRPGSCRVLGSPRPQTSSDRPRSRTSRSSSQSSLHNRTCCSTPPGTSPTHQVGPKPPGHPPKSCPAQRYGLVTEFLRRVSGRNEKTEVTQKTRSDPKPSDPVQTRPPCAASLHRSGSINRKKGFMRPREEAAQAPRTRPEPKSQRICAGEHEDSSSTGSGGSAPLSLCFKDKRYRGTAVVGAASGQR